MSFNVSLSGLSAAQKDLDVTSNNIANVNTTGFKESRAEFADVYAASLFTNSKTKAGDGVATSTVAQQFHQGSRNDTNNALDMAITGSGFFATVPTLDSRELTYTRAGHFKLNDENFVVDNNGHYLQGYPVNNDGTSSSTSLGTTQAIQIPETAGTPVPSSEVTMQMNLPADEEAHDVAAFDPTNSDTFNHATSVTVYDSLGNSHLMTTYYVKPQDASYTGTNQWVVFATVDDVPVDLSATAQTYPTDTDGDGAPDATGTAQAAAVTNPNTGVAQTLNGAVISFDDTGIYQNTSPDPIITEALGNTGAGVLPAGTDGTQTITLTFDNPTQFGGPFEMNTLTQDGLTVGQLTGIEVDADGLVKARYSNGDSQPISRVTIVRFRNEQGLQQVGDTSWKETNASGEPLSGEADNGTFGSISSSTLEASNVNLTKQLVNLIAAQRNFQANSQSLDTENQITQTILQIR